MDNGIFDIKVTCYVCLNAEMITFDEMKDLISKKELILNQEEKREVILMTGEDEKEIIGYGNLIIVNGRYGIQITELL